MPRAKKSFAPEERNYLEMPMDDEPTMSEEKSWWRSFNPTLREMSEKNPDLSVLGLWWAWYWRLACLGITIAVIFGIIVSIIVMIFGR